MSGVVSLISALAALTAAIGTVVNRKKIAEVHILVNSRMSEVQERVRELTGILDEHGVDIPPVRSVPVAVPRKGEEK